MIRVNAIGDACPLPVIKTKKALDELESGSIEVWVDNEIAVQNVQKYANTTGCRVEYSKLDDHYVINIEKVTKNNQQQPVATANSSVAEHDDGLVTGKTIVILSSERMGSGDDELGMVLMKGFVFALTQLDALPDTILLYNSGAKLSIQGTATINDLMALEQAGVEIMTCGTCLNHFGLADQLGVGEVTNMYSIVEEMRRASCILRP